MLNGSNDKGGFHLVCIHPGVGGSSFLYIHVPYYMQKGKESSACKIAYILNGRPLSYSLR